MESYGQKDTGMFVISAVDAFKLLQIKEILPHGTTVNIQGEVTAVSEIVRINKDSVFLIDLDGKSKVVVKQPQFHKWHQQLVIGRPFVFTNLRPTTLSKSYIPRQRVFVPWMGSDLFSENVDIRRLICLSLEDWLNNLGLSIPPNAQDHGNCCNEDNDVSISGDISSYQGVITDKSQSEFRIFEMDNSTELFLCFLPELDQPKQIDVGDVVTVHNVHHSLCAKTQKKQLLCCMRSSIQIAKSVQHRDEVKKREPSFERSSSLPLSLLMQYKFTPNDVGLLLQLYGDMCKALGQPPSLDSEARQGYKEILQYLVKSTLCPPKRHPIRNYLMEFCQHQTFCPLSDSLDTVKDQIPQLTVLAHMIQDITVSIDMKAYADLNLMTLLTSSVEDGLWKFDGLFNIDKAQKHMLGWLTVSPSSGRLQLMDSQASVDVVMVDSEGNPAKCTHLCQTGCDHHSSLKSAQSLCPFVRQCCLGHLIYIKNYTVVKETFCEARECSDNYSDGRTKVLLYLLLSTQDCVIIKDKDFVTKSGLERTSSNSNENNMSDTVHRVEKIDNQQLCQVELSSTFVYLTEKHHMFVQNRHKKRQTCLQFCAEGSLADPENFHVQNRSICCEGGNKGFYKKVIRVTERKEENVVEGKFCSSESTSNCLLDSKSLQKFQFPFSSQHQCEQPLFLIFEGENCKWFDLIHPPGMYRFVGREDAVSLQPTQADSKLQTVMNKAKTRKTVRVQTTAVDRIICGDSNENSPIVPSLKSVLSDDFSERLLSFRGVVTWRQHPLPQFPEQESVSILSDSSVRREQTETSNTLSSLLGRRSLCIGVRDENDLCVTASVYIGTSALIYPQGLLPGAVVDFYRLGKRTSKTNKIYFSFLHVSSLHVRSGPASAKKHEQPARNETNPLSWEDTPKQLLIDLWQQPHPSHDVFTAACHIYQLFNVSIKSVCAKCQSLFQSVGCSSPACTNKLLSQLSARISMLVDDGSCQAVVHISKYCSSDVARKLFLMSKDQWTHVETTVQHHGELFLQKFGCRGGTCLEDLLSLLCDSSKVKRPCWLMLRKPLTFKNQTTGQFRDATSVFETLTNEELVVHKINTGDTVVDTLELPYLQLECLDIKEM